jgi:hypothetical protein
MKNKLVTDGVANMTNIPPIEGGNVRQECSPYTRELCSLMFACSPKMFAFEEMKCESGKDSHLGLAVATPLGCPDGWVMGLAVVERRLYQK